MTQDPNCIFCKIIAGEIPCYRLLETEQVLAFLDVMPLSRGHCLVIPKRHMERIDAMSAEEASACAAVIPGLSKALQDATGCEGWNVLQNNGQIAGQAVMHVHFHLIPRAAGDELGFRWPAGKLEEDDAKALAGAIAGAL